MPFRGAIVSLVEARIHIEPMEAERVAGALTDLTRAIAGAHASISGTYPAPAASCVRFLQ